MSEQRPERQGYWEGPPGRSHSTGGYQPPPGYQSGGWAQRPYAPYPGYGPPYGAPCPQPAPPGSSPATGSTVGALIVAVITMMTCGGTNIIGVILACVALGVSDRPHESAKLTRFAWISNWIHLGILVAIIILITGLIATA